MAKAFVLINCELGTEKQVVTDLEAMDCVKQVSGTFGAYDFLANLECDNCEKLRELIKLELKRIKNVRSTITLMNKNGVC